MFFLFVYRYFLLLRSNQNNGLWIVVALDIYCGEKTQFISLKPKKGGGVTIGDSKILPILGKGNVGNSTTFIYNVRYFKGIKYNLLSVSQLHDDGHKVVFKKNKCVITVGTNKIPLVARREHNVYVLDFDLQDTCYKLDLNDH